MQAFTDHFSILYKSAAILPPPCKINNFSYLISDSLKYLDNIEGIVDDGLYKGVWLTHISDATVDFNVTYRKWLNNSAR